MCQPSLLTISERTKESLSPKWRLSSNHNLHIERGHYTNLRTPIEERAYKICPTCCVRDEVHFKKYSRVHLQLDDARVALPQMKKYVLQPYLEEGRVDGETSEPLLLVTRLKEKGLSRQR